MPGSGKTTLGEQLADNLVVEFVDLDVEIEKQESKSIPEIFRTKGEDYFREIESQVLLRWAALTKSFVMATGGGTPCFYQGIDVINRTGISVFLDVPVKDIVKRLSSSKNRPLLQTNDDVEREERLKKILESRITIYDQATIRLHSPTADELLKAVRVKN